jgi:hypothetical protein
LEHFYDSTAQYNIAPNETNTKGNEYKVCLIKNNPFPIPLGTYSLKPDNRLFENLFSLISGLDILIIKISKRFRGESGTARQPQQASDAKKS